MKRVLISVALLAGAIVAHAQTFTNHTVSKTIASSSHSIVSSGSSVSLNLTGFGFTTGFEDIAWSFDFTSPANQAYTQVQFVVEGDVFDGSLEVVGSENVYDTSSGTANVVLQDILAGTATGGNSVANSFSLSKTFTLTPNLFKGNVSKDVLFIFTPNSSGSYANITSIKQVFTPVPEPASMAAMVIGLGAVAARRRRK